MWQGLRGGKRGEWLKGEENGKWKGSGEGLRDGRGRANGREKVGNKRERVKGGKRMGRMCGRIRETCHIYDILYSINLPIQM